ncbi:MAG: WXG100 family type VII secretion target [Actinomycetota bacterium]
MAVADGGFQVTPSTLDGAASDLRGAGNGITSVGATLSGLAGSGQALTGHGGAGAAFDGMISTWTKELSGLGDFVAGTGDGTSAAASNYTVTEFGVSEMFGGAITA